MQAINANLNKILDAGWAITTIRKRDSGREVVTQASRTGHNDTVTTTGVDLRHAVSKLKRAILDHVTTTDPPHEAHALRVATMASLKRSGSTCLHEPTPCRDDWPTAMKRACSPCLARMALSVGAPGDA